MIDLFEIFSRLLDNNHTSESLYSVESIPGSINHKIGITKEGRPLFFIRCKPEKGIKVLDNNLELISVSFNKECKLRLSNSNEVSDCFTIIELKSDISDLHRYFIEVIYILIKTIGADPSFIELKNEVEKIVDLFSRFKKAGSKSLQGIWGELFVIASSMNPNYLINSWHISPNDKFDFNDGVDKIEVKTTSKSSRKHIFSLEQLLPNPSSQLVIASIFVVQTGVGKSILDLVEIICSKDISSESNTKLHFIIGETLGTEIMNVSQTFFDYNLALDSLKFYSSEIIPKIESSLIPNEISNVKFECDISNCQCITEISSNSMLHQSIRI
jgi:hypothetical protein